MKKLILILIVITGIHSCIPYKSFVEVQQYEGIADGAKDIVTKTNIDTLRNLFKSNTILLKNMDGGFQTDEIMLDEGMSVMYKAIEFDDDVIIQCFYKFSQLKHDVQNIWMTGLAGLNTMGRSYNPDAWLRAYYIPKNSSAKAVKVDPNKALFYAFQLLDSKSISYIIK